MVQIKNPAEAGNGPLALILIVGGLSMGIMQTEFSGLNKRVNEANTQGERRFNEGRNVSSFQQASRLLLADNVGGVAPVYPDPYIVGGACSSGRKFNASSGSNWSSSAFGLRVESFSSKLLHQSTDEIFDRLGQGSRPGLNTDLTTRLRVLGFKCSSNASSPYLMESVYVEATEDGNSVQKSATKALLALSPPPPSQCRFYVKDPDGEHYPANLSPSPGQELEVMAKSVALYFDCDQVVTEARIRNNGSVIAATNSYPLTAARRINGPMERMLGPITLQPGTHNLSASAGQVDGSLIRVSMELTVTNDVDKNICRSKCITLGDGRYPPAYSSSYYYKGYYQRKDLQVLVCYRSDKFYGFDPLQDCKNIGPIRDRTTQGCFASDTLIRMEDGSERAISGLSQGDRIWNPLLKRGMILKTVVRGPESIPLLRLHLKGRSVDVTSGHPFRGELPGIIAAKELRVGDKILAADGGWEQIEAIQELASDAPREVWNIEIETDIHDESHHMILANGIMTGDLYLQQRINSRPLLEAVSRLKKLSEQDPL